jgi:hypothetical protein
MAQCLKILNTQREYFAATWASPSENGLRGSEARLFREMSEPKKQKM